MFTLAVGVTFLSPLLFQATTGSPTATPETEDGPYLNLSTLYRFDDTRPCGVTYDEDTKCWLSHPTFDGNTTQYPSEQSCVIDVIKNTTITLTHYNVDNDGDNSAGCDNDQTDGEYCRAAHIKDALVIWNHKDEDNNPLDDYDIKLEWEEYYYTYGNDYDGIDGYPKNVGPVAEFLIQNGLVEHVFYNGPAECQCYESSITIPDRPLKFWNISVNVTTNQFLRWSVKVAPGSGSTGWRMCAGEPSIFLTDNPTATPTTTPTTSPSKIPTSSPTGGPTESPTANPTMSPSLSPTNNPTESPTANPTESPTANPTESPTSSPTGGPTESPTANPTESPTESPTSSPTGGPTESPTANPTMSPSLSPTYNPTGNPTANPTASPTLFPTITNNPTENPTESPTANPTESPTETPTENPTKPPSLSPTKPPSLSSTNKPTANPTESSTANPTNAPTNSPTNKLNDSDDSDDSELSTGAIIGISAGGFAGLVLLVVLIRRFRKRYEMSSTLNTRANSPILDGLVY